MFGAGIKMTVLHSGAGVTGLHIKLALPLMSGVADRKRLEKRKTTHPSAVLPVSSRGRQSGLMRAMCVLCSWVRRR